MCFLKRIRYNNDLAPCIAAEDITVYKVLHYQSIINVNNVLVCTYTPFKHKVVRFFFGKAVLQVTHFTGKLNNTIISIEEGIHSYTELDLAKTMISRLCSTTHRVHKAIIPKGAKYYTNNSGEAVSTKLIIYKESISIE